MSERTVRLHYEKHHKGYVDKLNKLVEGTPLAKLALEEVIHETADDAEREPIFNNAAQVWNHTLFWHCMKPKADGAPSGEFGEMLGDTFGGLKAFKETFVEAAEGRFGSGYVWLVLDNNRLEVISTLNAIPPFVDGASPLLACDIWEHAYYLDHQNERATFVKTFLDHLVDWEFVAERLDKARAGKLREVA